MLKLVSAASSVVASPNSTSSLVDDFLYVSFGLVCLAAALHHCTQNA